MPDQPQRPDQPQKPGQPPRSDQPNAQTGRPGAPNRPAGAPSEEEKEQFRQPTFWYNAKDRETSFRMEDKRWAPREQVKDWLKLALLVLLTLAWHLAVYFIEPGLR